MMKFLLSILLIAALSVRSVAGSDEIVAIVNKHPITFLELQQMKGLTLFISHIPKISPEQERGFTNSVLQNMIDEEVIKQYAQEIGLKISDIEVNRAISNIETSNKMLVGQLQQKMLNAHVNPSLFKEKIRTEMLRSKIVNEVLGRDVDVTREDVDSIVLDANLRDAKLHLKVFTSKKRNNDKTYKSMNKLSSRIKNCNHTELLRYNSFATMSDIKTKLSELSPGVQAQMKDLPVGNATGVIKGEKMQVMLLCGKEIENFGDNEINHISQIVANKKLGTKARKFLQNLRKKAYVKIMI